MTDEIQLDQHRRELLEARIFGKPLLPTSSTAKSLPVANQTTNCVVSGEGSNSVANSLHCSPQALKVVAYHSDMANNVNGGSAAQFFLAPQPQMIPPALPNEGSNMSSAGSASDRDETPEKKGPSANFSLVIESSGSNAGSDKPSEDPPPPPAKGSERKRKRRKKTDLDANNELQLGSGAEVSAKTPKTDRKISEYFNKQNPNSSPSHRSPSGNLLVATGHSAAFKPNQLKFAPISPQPVTGPEQQNHVPVAVGALGTTNAVAGSCQRTTPTLPICYSVTDGPSWNHSLPTASVSQQSVFVQTDLTMEAMDSLAQEKEAASQRLARQFAEMERYANEIKQQLLAQQRKTEEQSAKLAHSRDTTKKLLIEQSTMERKQRRTSCMEDRLRLGQFDSVRKGVNFEDVWNDGFAFAEIHKKLQQINAEKDEISRASQLLRKRKPSSSAREQRRQQQQAAQGVAQLTCTASATSSGTLAADGSISPSPSTSAAETDDGFVKPDPPKETMSLSEYYEQDEIYRLRREALKREEAELQAELARLDRARNLHIRELKRIQHEDASRYKDHVVLNKRYLLLNLLGKGGFSEVWRSFDLEDNRYVACKIHHVNKDWKEDKKANYVKHAMREKDIHKTLDHPRIVKLYDVFMVDNHSFCTFLEYCNGNDLDFYLKQNKQIPEKEARSIIMQVVSALRYLNEIKPPVIHYDLKPANILLSSGNASGEIKITDFGLSKVMEDDKYDPDSGMDLTSQGAGTYWYLPPECFVIGNQPPKISSKVDVWSVGVIFYQCLYGRRPFGHDQTQAKILEENTILRATEVTFPNKPTVSFEAKAFIRCCLQYRKEDRSDVFQLSEHEYFKPRGQRSQSSSNTVAAPSPTGSNPAGGGGTPT